MNTPVRLHIKLDDLIDALTFNFELTDAGWYLDRQTGDVLLDADGAEDLPEDLADNPRYLPVEPMSSHEGLRIMEAFIATVANPQASDRLAEALSGRKPFRRFKDALLDYLDLRESWFAFEQAAHRELATEWCKDNGIEPEWL